ncbi:hypothetical protein NCCP1664_10040 [Zafaria cholistanensis]|uniref:Phosphatidic acid phosphatase type 2/haloperoxidase domain-containing protein n=1 Tax=Zafaria cholistanensis TaxID=1682741 RepID=A0A5A7NRA1_9MICC|nr:phosphatase PAP2 family protein [Zafaria cholistanensis]GER22507.1 hypothetical protein NCCP1664_10040 [Zafaria cholistanensis]
MIRTKAHPPRRGASHRAAPHPALWILGMLCVAAAFGAVYWGFVLTVTGQLADETALRGAEAYLGADAARRPALAFLGYLPEASAVIGALALLAAAVVRRSVWGPAVAAAAFAASVLSAQVLKHLVLERPDKDISAASVNSFPSGHTTFAAAAMVAVLLVASPRWRPLVAALGGLYAAVAGMATLVLGWHRPADILGAYLVAAFWGLLGGLVLLRREPWWNVWDGPDAHWASARLWQAVLWVPGLGGLAGAVAVYQLAIGPPALQGTAGLLGWHLLAAVLFIGGSAAFLFGLGSAFFAQQTRRRD